jgi:hypothetical protein
MESIDRIRFGNYIVAQLQNSKALIEMFNSNEPKELALQKKIDERNILPAKETPAAKTVYNLLRNNTEESSEKTLNFTAKFFNIEPCDIDDFCRAWRHGQIIEKDLKIDKQVSITGRNYSQIKPYIETYIDISNRVLTDFVGRQFIFDRVDRFISSHDRGYFFIKGNPGIGKTALAAKLVRDKKYYFHVINAQNTRTNTEIEFIKNICSQLIIDKKLPIEELPEDIYRNGKFLLRVLQEVSTNLHKNEKAIIVVDGLDELRDLTLFQKTNILYLPNFLPPKIYFVLTMRDIDDQIRLPSEENKEVYKIKYDGEENTKDVSNYIKEAIKDEKTQEYLLHQNILETAFLETLEKKSEGNFMYLKHVIHEIKDGFYHDATLNQIPTGLEGYYKDHWNRMMEVPVAIKDVKLKTIYILSEMNNPISTEFLSNMIKSNIDGVDNIQVQEILNEWKQFLNIKTDDDGEKLYSFYHKSFLDFLRSNEMIKAAGFNVKDVNGIIVDYMTKGLFT